MLFCGNKQVTEQSDIIFEAWSGFSWISLIFLSFIQSQLNFDQVFLAINFANGTAMAEYLQTQAKVNCVIIIF